MASRKMQSIELAELLGCTVQKVSRIKNGKVRAFRIDTMDSICKLFECQPGDILEYMDDDEATKLFGEEFMEGYRKYYDE